MLHDLQICRMTNYELLRSLVETPSRDIRQCRVCCVCNGYPAKCWTCSSRRKGSRGKVPVGAMVYLLQRGGRSQTPTNTPAVTFPGMRRNRIFRMRHVCICGANARTLGTTTSANRPCAPSAKLTLEPRTPFDNIRVLHDLQICR